MSKKIIYLLSLLMALSLMFASCKKNGLSALGDGPSKPEVTPPPSTGLEGGMFTNAISTDYDTKPVQESEVAKYANKQYKRNPVISVLGGQTVLIVYEIRHESPGSANDTALTGTNTVDIAYQISTDGGISFNDGAAENIINKANSPEDSHGAPIVYNTGKHVVIVASAGVGLGVGSYDKANNKVSKLQYTVAEIQDAVDANNGPTLGTFSSWADLTITESDVLNGTDVTFEQYGTQSARGVCINGSDGNSTLLLPITVGKFIKDDNGLWGQSRWGFRVLAVTFTASSKQLSNPTAKGTGVVELSLDNKTKATRVASATSADAFITLTVSDHTDANKLQLFQGANGDAPTISGIFAGDGSAGTLVVKDWKGSTSYNPSDYAKTFESVSGLSTGGGQALLSHVVVLEKGLAIRLVNNDFNTENSRFTLGGAYANNSKSSAIDILKDGTIVMVAEGGKVQEGVSRPFYINFNRYTQAYIANQAK